MNITPKLPMLIAAVLAIGLMLPVSKRAQTRAEQTEIPINAVARTETIESVLRRLNDSYGFPEVAAQMEKSIRLRIQKANTIKLTAARSWLKRLHPIYVESAMINISA